MGDDGAGKSDHDRELERLRALFADVAVQIDINDFPPEIRNAPEPLPWYRMPVLGSPLSQSIIEEREESRY